LENSVVIRRLEQRNHQLELEITILLQKYQTCQAPEIHSQRVKQLEHEVKQQLIINLELEQLLLRRKVKDERQLYTDKGYQEIQVPAMIKELKLELV
jgi:hypothetical protein